MSSLSRFSPSWIRAGAAAQEYAALINAVSNGDEDALLRWQQGQGLRLLTELVAAERSRALGAYQGEVEGFLNSILVLLAVAEKKS
ncbi:hypothetical protein [Synechococcus elongatus]|uniref:Uncharacterized protein n=1 Tax=Synechococcus elongatus (strain ATCC 33912 / PCC 7942 / FACHB-805) TaxID=1140 RepID=Q31MB3_SYNE7|nr:hypothetical protein [Synechococcus elongatus]ABB57806.1 hypothetical protein Synpcc7942_1776 [Synechococcus elongatus PCC 7942 = FACHB-805]AJD58884.1 hypothetical protein M744_07600 [Synechococcus elongatus UTEX 2973]MBD2586522.1 hypothetical protein [Synechococcus elongatus FACHB-242]MBD2687596.1 hypothetical protein [Synechococcus elongatus FACHB-1061]MBD2706695.1 hypothetical protein [Synechococcus elongatus PCC 7942 = FACHB-805]